jgi:hypothetical protein
MCGLDCLNRCRQAIVKRAGRRARYHMAAGAVRAAN